MTAYIQAGDTEVLQVLVLTSAGAALTGSSNIRVDIRRASDDFFLDFADGTFKASGWTTRLGTMSEVSASNAPGWYKLSVTATSWASGAYVVNYSEVTTTDAGNLPAGGEIRVGASVGTLTATAQNALVDAIWDEVLTGATHNVATSAGRRLREIAAARLVLTGTASAGSITTITLTGGSADDHIYQFSLVIITAGMGAGQCRTILDYNGTTKVATVGPEWHIAPNNTSEFTVVPFSSAAVVDAGTLDGATISTVVLNEHSHTTDDHYVGMTIVILSGTGAGQSRIVTDYVGSTLTATVTPAWTTTPDTTSAYVLLGSSLASALAALASISAGVAALPSASATASQVWATAEGSPSSGTFGYDLKLLRMGLTNRLEESAGSPGLVRLYADDGTTLFKTWQVRDASGGAVTAQSGAPAKRGAAT